MLHRKGGDFEVRLYTCTYQKFVRLDTVIGEVIDLFTTLLEAETPALALHLASKRTCSTKWTILVEEGDTLYKHPGAQVLIFEPAQIDIEEIIP
jgi:hypothetical protein